MVRVWYYFFGSGSVRFFGSGFFCPALLEEDEGDRVKYAFLKRKKNDGIFVNNLNFGGERGKWKFQKKHELVLYLTSSFESYLPKSPRKIGKKTLVWEFTFVQRVLLLQKNNTNPHSPHCLERFQMGNRVKSSHEFAWEIFCLR